MVDAILGVYHGLFEEKMEFLLDRDQEAVADNLFGIEGSMFERIIDVLRGNPMITKVIIYGSLRQARQVLQQFSKRSSVFLAKVKLALGEQKIDVLVDYPDRKNRPEILRIARAQGVQL